VDSISLSQICGATNGKLEKGDPQAPIGHISTDTRTLPPGSLFIALRGERFDGHAFIGSAVGQGAAAVMVEDTEGVPENAACIRVADTLAAFKELAAWYRSRFDIPLIAVTGSTGKTSTKDMTAAMLSALHDTHKNTGNLNNEIGLSHTLLGLERHHAAAVVEMGMNHAGEIAVLSRMAGPTVAVITNIGHSHIGNLGSRENILAAKLEVLEGMAPGAPLVINGDDPMLTQAAEAMTRPVIRCGFSGENDVRALDVRLMGEQGSAFTAAAGEDRCEIELSFPGRHSIQNCLCALGAVRAAGLSLMEAAEGIKALAAPKMRFCIDKMPNGTRIINDAYNASPDSVAAALDVLMDMQARRRYAVLGDMLEMGDYAPQVHYDTGGRAAGSGVDVLVAVGPLSVHTARGARDAGMDDSFVFHCLDHAGAVTYLRALLGPGDAVLVKGSRGMRMEQIVDALIDTR
jgi:UDP-N-acetylmuramoyl-tripeptide--D-alanyl-D-alanine ligase